MLAGKRIVLGVTGGIAAYKPSRCVAGSSMPALTSCRS
jgi:phosphopantothenoylcysteine synthetase/decarboxylase